jgi:hypothetical protein
LCLVYPFCFRLRWFPKEDRLMHLQCFPTSLLVLTECNFWNLSEHNWGASHKDVEAPEALVKYTRDSLYARAAVWEREREGLCCGSLIAWAFLFTWAFQILLYPPSSQVWAEDYVVCAMSIAANLPAAASTLNCTGRDTLMRRSRLLFLTLSILSMSLWQDPKVQSCFAFMVVATLGFHSLLFQERQGESQSGGHGRERHNARMCSMR